MKAKSARPVGPRVSLTVQYGVSTQGLPTRAQFRRWASAALQHEACIALRIVGQKQGRTLNRNFSNKDYATNVLTFVLHDQPPFTGDIALCAPVVAREARTQGKLLAAHYAHLTVHGVLHLQGHDHQNHKAARAMECRETRIMAKLGYADPYQTQ